MLIEVSKQELLYIQNLINEDLEKKRKRAEELTKIYLEIDKKEEEKEKC